MVGVGQSGNASMQGDVTCFRSILAEDSPDKNKGTSFIHRDWLLSFSQQESLGDWSSHFTDEEI